MKNNWLSSANYYELDKHINRLSTKTNSFIYFTPKYVHTVRTLFLFWQGFFS